MTVHQLRRLTPAEEAVVSRAEAGLAEGDDARWQAVAVLRREGLPHRRVEAWHYTDLRSLIGSPKPGLIEKLVDLVTPSAKEEPLAPLLPGSLVVDLDDAAPLPDVMPSGLSIARRPSVPDWRVVVNHLDRDVDTIRLLNAAFGGKSTSLTVAADVRLPQAIELRPDAGKSGAHSYAVCTVGENAGVTFVERLSSDRDNVLSNSVCDLSIGDGADVLWIVDQAKGTSETHLGQLNVTVGRNAAFRLFMLNAGGGLVRLEVHVETRGEGAAITMRGVNLLHEGQHIDVTTTLNHTVANTTSTETFRNVVMGGRGVFQGMIKVSKGAQKTDARMACNTLLLSEDGDFSAKPELEIFADDVQCGHGATAGEIDGNHLFYLMSRGIPERDARALLVKAFVAEVVEELENEAAIEALENRIDAWLAVER